MEYCRNTCDFILFIANSLNGIAKITSLSSNDILYNSLPLFFVNVNRAIRNADEVNIYSREILFEKAVVAFDLLNTLAAFAVKLDSVRSFLKIHLGKLQSLYFYCTSGFTKAKYAVNSQYFEQDTSVLGRLYQEIYELSSNVAINSDIENLPMLFFSLLLQPVPIT